MKPNSNPVLHKSPQIPCKCCISGKFRKLLVPVHKRVSREKMQMCVPEADTVPACMEAAERC